jgi:uncharacterized membrane protein SirB2
MLVAGFILLGQGPVRNPLSWIIAPLVLVIAYVVVIPLALIVREPRDTEGHNQK